MFKTFDNKDFHALCDKLANGDADLLGIITAYGYPPLWSRPNTFESLVHIILEQQVSLASALAAINKLRGKVEEITPENLLQLTNDELKACFFSRQKAVYVKELAAAIQSRQVDLTALAAAADDEVRALLSRLKGIGNWTIDIYLIMVLHRADIFPLGDLAAVNAVKAVKRLPKDISKDALLETVSQYAPYCTIAAMLFWQYYLSVRKYMRVKE